MCALIDLGPGQSPTVASIGKVFMKRAIEDIPHHRGLHEDPKVSVAGRQSCGFS